MVTKMTGSGGPLENLVIISQILSFLPHRDLKTVRRVSRFWKKIASPLFASRSVLELDLLSPTAGRTPTDFWNKLGNLPTSHLKLVRVPSRDPGLVQLFSKFGAKIKSLSVDAAACGDDEMGDENTSFPKNYFLQISQWCPSLESLVLLNLPPDVVDSGFPPLMRSVMTGACPTLKSVSFTCSSYYCGLDANFLLDLLDFAPNVTNLAFSIEDDDALDEVFTALEFRPSRVSFLRALSFEGSVLYEAQVAMLANFEELRYNLNSLNLGRLGVDVQEECVTDLLEQLSGTLTILEVVSTHGPLHLPQLPHLTHLRLDHVRNENYNASIFFESFPNLENCMLGGVVHVLPEKE